MPAKKPENQSETPAKRKSVRRQAPTVIISFSRMLQAKAGSYDAWSIRQGLVLAGLWERLEKAQYVVGEDTIKLNELTPEQRWQHIIDQQWRKAMQGDTAAAKAYKELSQEGEKKRAFDCRIILQSYEVDDKNLPDIVMDADEKPVMEILRAWCQRARIDKCPPEIVEKAEALFEEWRVWAEVAFKDVLDVRPLPKAIDGSIAPMEPMPTEEPAELSDEFVEQTLEKLMAE